MRRAWTTAQPVLRCQCSTIVLSLLGVAKLHDSARRLIEMSLLCQILCR